MTKIKTARTAEGEKFYYLGHTQAVVDDNGNNIEDLLAEQEEKIELLNDNTGVSDYPEFSTSKTYKTGTIVRHEGALFKFTSDHEPGIWDLEEVKSWSINAESQEKLTELGSKVGNFCLVGDDGNISIFNYKNTIGGHIYRVYLDNPNYDISGVPEGFIILNVGYIVNGEATYLYQPPTFRTLEKYYDVEIPSESVGAEIIVSIRATKGVEVGFRIEDITESKALAFKFKSDLGIFLLKGDGNRTVSYKNEAESGHSYRLTFINPDYNTEGVNEEYPKLNYGYMYNNDFIAIESCLPNEKLKKSYDISIPNGIIGVELGVYIRAKVGEDVKFTIKDVSNEYHVDLKVNEHANILQGESYAVYGGIDENNGAIVENNIRAVTLPIRHSIKDNGKEVKVKCSIPETIIFNGISYAYLGENPIKNISVVYEDGYLTYMADSLFDNIRTTFKRLDGKAITNSELRNIVIFSEGLEIELPYIQEASSIAMSLIKKDEIYAVWDVGGITASGNNAESEGLLRTSMMGVNRKLTISVPSQIQNYCFYVLYKNGSAIGVRISDAPLSIDKNSFPYDYDAVRPILLYDKELYSPEEIIEIVKDIHIETEYIDVGSKEENMKYKGLLMCSIGDSITYGHTPTGTPNAGKQLDSYAKLAASKLGMKFLNYGISGNRMAGTSTDNPMCIRFSSMDNDADVVTFMGGTNDIRNGVPLGSMNDRGTATYYGALHTIMSGLYRKYVINNNKKVKIVAITPPKLIGTPSTTAYGEGTIRPNQEEWINAVIEVAKYYSIPVLDFFHNGMIATQLAGDYYKDLSDYYGYKGYFNPLIPDGIHPTQEGHEIISDLLVGFLNGLR